MHGPETGIIPLRDEIAWTWVIALYHPWYHPRDWNGAQTKHNKTGNNHKSRHTHTRLYSVRKGTPRVLTELETFFLLLRPIFALSQRIVNLTALTQTCKRSSLTRCDRCLHHLLGTRQITHLYRCFFSLRYGRRRSEARSLHECKQVKRTT